jgi:hypothetical protein
MDNLKIKLSVPPPKMLTFEPRMEILFVKKQASTDISDSGKIK